mgnify:CR=1 FL=1
MEFILRTCPYCSDLSKRAVFQYKDNSTFKKRKKEGRNIIWSQIHLPVYVWVEIQFVGETVRCALKSSREAPLKLPAAQGAATTDPQLYLLFSSPNSSYFLPLLETQHWPWKYHSRWKNTFWPFPQTWKSMLGMWPQGTLAPKRAAYRSQPRWASVQWLWGSARRGCLESMRVIRGPLIRNCLQILWDQTRLEGFQASSESAGAVFPPAF